MHPTPLWLKKYEIKKGEHLSKNTEFKTYSKYVTKICVICGKEKAVTENHANKYWKGCCSKQCADNRRKTGLSIKKICEQCGKEFRVIPYYKDTAKFCSNKCRGASRVKLLKDKSWRYTKEYQLWRIEILTKDNFTCQICGKEKCDVVHHIKDWTTFPELRYDIKNGMTLCRSCHIKLHKKDIC